MKRRTIGRTDIEVTELGFGAAPIGNLYRAIDDDTAQEAVDTAWASGVRYFDTAPHYGLGLSESRLGRALADRPRAEFVISTKVGRLLVPNPSPVGNDMANGFDVPDTQTRVRDYSRDGVLRSIESSLQRLAVDRLDIVYIHDSENHMDEAIRSAFPALQELRDVGSIGAIGAGMNMVDPLLRFVRETAVDIVMVAGRWTLVDNSAEPLLQECTERGISVAAAAPFNSGLLARSWPADDASFDYGPVSSRRLAKARSLAQTCADLGAELPHAALQFPLRSPAVACVVTGMRTAKQVRQDVNWMRTPLPWAVWSALESEIGQGS